MCERDIHPSLSVLWASSLSRRAFFDLYCFSSISIILIYMISCQRNSVCFYGEKREKIYVQVKEFVFVHLLFRERMPRTMFELHRMMMMMISYVHSLSRHFLCATLSCRDCDMILKNVNNKNEIPWTMLNSAATLLARFGAIRATLFVPIYE